MVVEVGSAEDVDEAAKVVVEVVVVEAAVIVMDPARIAAITAARNMETVDTMVLVPTMTRRDLGDPEPQVDKILSLFSSLTAICFRSSKARNQLLLLQ